MRIDRVRVAVVWRTAGMLVLATAVLSGTVAMAAIPLPSLDLELTWDARYDGVAGEFVYRYTITDLRGEDRTGRVTIAEDQDGGHAGLHDEVDFLIPGAAIFKRDSALVGFPAHNYDWSNVLVPANGSVTLGFSDPVHGPHGEDFGIDQGSGRVTVFGVPVPGLHLWELSLQPDPNNPSTEKTFRHLGSTASPLASGNWQYKHFLRNVGNVPIGNQMAVGGPCPNDPNIDPVNYVDFYLNEHPSHRGVHDETFNLPDNAFAQIVRLDSPGHDGLPLPAGIRNHNYAFELIGNGPANVCWLPGTTLTVGWTDPHAPARVASGGRIVGSEVEGFFDEEAQLVTVPSASILEIPTVSLPGLVILGVLLVLGSLALLALRP